MQEQTIVDADGVSREYAYDDYNGALFVKDAQSIAQGFGRPYRPIYAAKRADIRGLGSCHAEMWANPENALVAIGTVAIRDAWRAAH